MVQYKSCCAFTDVHTGTKIISILCLVGGIVGLISLIVQVSAEFPAFNQIVASWPQQAVEGAKITQATFSGIIAACFLVTFFFLAVNGCLLHGSFKRKPGFVLFWLVIHMIALIVS